MKKVLDKLFTRKSANPISPTNRSKNQTGRGLINGTGTSRTFTLHNSSGFVNGNGLTNGNAFVNGNGLTNGNGFTNGAAKFKRTNRETHIELLRTRTHRQRFLSATVALILILLPLTLYLTEISDIENNYIAIDGEFEDWQSIHGYSDQVGDQSENPNVDITDYRFNQDAENGYLAFYIEVNGIMMKGKKISYSEDQVFGLDTVHIFIDSDCSPTTGYLINELGADHLIEVKGYNNWIQSSTLKRFDNYRNQFDWNGWEYMHDVEARCRDRRLETKIWLAEVGWDNSGASKVSLGFHIQDSDGNEDQADIIIGNHDNIILVSQTNCMPDVIERSDGPVRILDLKFNSIHQTSYLNEIEMNIHGTVEVSDIENIELFIDNENIKLADAEISGGVAKFMMDEPLELESAQDYSCYITVELSSTATSQRTMGLNVDTRNNILLTDQESLVDIETLNQGLSYIGECPDNIEIDGAFGDWAAITTRHDKDPCENRNIDINRYKIAQGASEISFYFEVEGEMMDGTFVPIKPDIVTPVNIQPTPIANEPQSQAAIENIGAQINEHVPAPELFGEDAAYIFIDTDLNDTTGYIVDDQSIGAEYLIQFTGKNGVILSSNYYKFRVNENLNSLSTQTWDNWQYLGRVPGAQDSTRLETKLDFTKLDFYSKSIEGLNIFFYFEDWAKNQDSINEPVNITGFDESSNMQGSEGLFGTRGAGDPLNVLVSGVGNDANDGFGWNVSDLGDINNDGYDDIIVGAPFNDGYNGLDSWWDSNWYNRKKLIFNNSGQTEDLTEFPVLVNLSSSNFDYLKAKNDGTDLRFIDEDGSSELIYHIEEWNAAGYSQIWVNVTKITGSSDTDYIWMYYNNSAALDVQDVDSTYNSNYTGVWHLNETGTGTRYDSTNLANHGTPGGYEGDEATAGKISGADDFDNGGTGDSLNCGIDAIADTPYHTISAWLNMDLTTGDANNLSVSHENFGAPQKGIGLYIQKSDGAIGKWLNPVYHYSSTNKLTTGVWAFVAIRGYNHSSTGYLEISLNGGAWENIFSGNTNNLGIIDGATLFFGKWLGPGPTRDANGIVDEVKISNVARSLDWIRAQFLSTNNSYITYGNEESYNKSNCGAAYIFYGYPSLELNDINASNANVTLTGASADDNFGWAVSSASDVDGNSYNDIIIGAPGADEAYIFLSLDDGSGIPKGASPNITLSGNSGDRFGYSVDSVGKFDKATEGFNDIIVGAPYNDTVYGTSNTIQNTGAVFFFYNDGSISTTINAIDANLTHRGENSSNYFGSSIAGVGDVNNDGYDDVVAGAPGYNNSQGRAYVYYGNSTYIDDDFEAYSGDDPGGNWVTSENEVDYIVDMTSAVSHGTSGSKSVFINESNILNVARLRDVTSLTGAPHYKLVVEFAVRVSTTIGTDRFIITLMNGTGKSGPTIIFEATGWIRYKDTIGVKDIMTYTDNIWYNFRLIADVRTSTFDCYIWSDSNTPPTTPQVEGGGFEYFIDKIERIVFTTGPVDQTLTGGWIDDVKIYNMTMLTGERQGDNFGWSVAGAGDVNGDNINDVIIGAPKYDSTPGVIDDNGRAYVFFGNSSNFGDTNTFFDGFELDLGKWDDNGITNWLIDTVQNHSGLQSVRATQGSEGYLTSDDIDLSGASAAFLEFWVRKDAVEAGDIMLQYFDGSIYNNISDLDDLGADNTWLKFMGNINISKYGISNFRIRFNATLGVNEYAWIDDVELKIWTYPETDAFSDDYETDLTKWDENGATLWFLSTDQKQEGLKSVKSEQNKDGPITSDDIDLTRASFAVLEFWYRKNLTDLNDFLLEFFDGSTYIEVQDFEDIGIDNAWQEYSLGIDLDLYKLQYFRVRFNATLGANEYIWIDNLTLKIYSDHNVVLTGATSGDHFGWAVGGAGDVNNDGKSDLIVGAPCNDSKFGTKIDAGAIYVFNGSASIESITSIEADKIFYGEFAGDRVGWAVSQAGNVDGTGSDNVIVSGPNFDDGAKADAGKIYILTTGTVIPEFVNISIPLIFIFIIIAIFRAKIKRSKYKNRLVK